MGRPGLQAELLILTKFNQRDKQSHWYPLPKSQLEPRPALAPCAGSSLRVA
jgi:hypothetical protein